MASCGTRNSMKRTGVCRVIARAVASHIAGKASPSRNTSWGAFGPSGFCQYVATCQCDCQSQAANAAARNHESSDCLIGFPTQCAARSCGNAVGF
jgi:hypothetical protein